MVINMSCAATFILMAASVIIMVSSSSSDNNSAPPPTGLSSSSSPADDQYTKLDSAMAVFLVFSFSFTLSVGFLAIFLRRCACGTATTHSDDNSLRRLNHSDMLPRTATTGPAALPDRGLPLEAVQALPAFMYSDVKMHRLGKQGLECAVCLNVFEDNDVLRLLPVCSHVFHPQCIDRWLCSRPTCPICRATLAPRDLFGESFCRFPLPPPWSDSDSISSPHLELSTVTDDHDPCNEAPTTGNVDVNTITAEMEYRVNESGSSTSQEDSTNVSRRPRFTELLAEPIQLAPSRSSLQDGEEDGDRFTLRLPEQLRDELAIPHWPKAQQQGGAAGSGNTDSRRKVALSTMSSPRSRSRTSSSTSAEKYYCLSSGGRRWSYSWTPPPPFRSQGSSPVLVMSSKNDQDNMTARIRKGLGKFKMPPPPSSDGEEISGS